MTSHEFFHRLAKLYESVSAEFIEKDHKYLILKRQLAELDGSDD